MSNPVISLYGSAVRPWLWERLYESLQHNKISFEIVFVGDRQYQGRLPDNVRHIYSEVKPAQCSEIACRNSSGELICLIPDDIVFSEHALDVLYEAFCDAGDDKTVVSPRYAYNNFLYPKEKHSFFDGDLNAPILPVCGFMKKNTWLRLGGVDKRFVAQCWDIDVIMRLYAIGGKVSLCDYALVTEVTNPDKPDQSNLWLEIGLPFDRVTLDSFWVKKHCELNLLNDNIHCINGQGVLMKTRLEPLMPIEDKDILTMSQGNRGRWR